MRLWHQYLIPNLPRQQLLGQHRECCALRGKGWGRKHSTVQYVFDHPIYTLYQYHLVVIGEMERRGYTADPLWKDWQYRGKSCEPLSWSAHESRRIGTLYPEHNLAYMEECVINLREKGVTLLKNPAFRDI